MAGHSKWAQIKHKKAKEDAKRGKIFTKLIREITVAARLGGGNPDANPRLRQAIAEAKAANMPAENIKRAIMRGTGELPGTSYTEVVYEGYGPGGVAVLVQALTDNRNRTTAEVRHLFSKHAGNLGENGCVSWMFEKKGYIVIPKDKVESEDKLMEIVLEAGAEDMRDDASNYEIITPPESLDQVAEALRTNGVEVAVAEVAMLPKNTVKVTGSKVRQLLSLLEGLEELDDVQKVWANFDIDEADLPS
ncbi:MAG: YebC/PmpR family DNA-binding transcriptional regulator [Acidobacteria bacterium]|nr:YebC/PmpR family DNA-binding transcriptional regulator [Acidobacteriota bacterium]